MVGRTFSKIRERRIEMNSSIPFGVAIVMMVLGAAVGFMGGAQLPPRVIQLALLERKAIEMPNAFIQYSAVRRLPK
jgi:hypothetical protein